MAPKTLKRGRTDESKFEALTSNGLKIIRVQADGNCLFRSLSHGLFGDEAQQHIIRLAIVDELRNNRHLYEPFVAVDGERRAPKRQARTRTATPFNASAATQTQVDKAWEDRLSKMSKTREWGDNMEIVAFTNLYGVDVRVWHEGGNEVLFSSNKEDVKTTLNIAYHGFQHYDAVEGTRDEAAAKSDNREPPVTAVEVKTQALSTPSKKISTKKIKVHKPARVTKKSVVREDAPPYSGSREPTSQPPPARRRRLVPRGKLTADEIERIQLKNLARARKNSG